MVPCTENDHKPHSLRDASIKVLLGLAILAELVVLFFLSPFFPQKLDYLAAVLPSILVATTNETRLEEKSKGKSQEDLDKTQSSDINKVVQETKKEITIMKENKGKLHDIALGLDVFESNSQNKEEI